RYGFETGGMFLEGQSAGFTGNTATNPILARPFTDAITGLPQAILISFPGVSTGAVHGELNSHDFYEAHFDLTETVCDEGWLRCEAFLGYRFYRFQERLRIAQSVSPLGAAFVPGTVITSTDDFGTQNEFHGCDVGWRATFQHKSLSVDFLAKVAFGQL